jgi:1-acyl-sn-glycerol-3-phosphate acyltransferase
MMTCHGLTKKGSPCRKHPPEGSLFCRFHQDQANEVSEQAFTTETLDDLEATRTEQGGIEEQERFEEQQAVAEEAEDLSDHEKQALYQAVWSRVKDLLGRLKVLVGEDLTDYAHGLWALAQNQLQTLNPLERFNLHRVMQDALESDILDPEFWEGLWFVVRFSVESKVDSASRHRRGEYEVDAFGMDEEFLDSFRPLLNFFYKIWWRVSTHHVENIPGEGRCLLAVNHSGVLPFDGAMVMAAVLNEHPDPRPVRNIYLRWFASIPFLNVILARGGQVVASPENAELLLEKEQLVSVFPEGIKGVGKLYKNRYKLARFGRGGFIRTAMRTLSPIVPVAVVGAEEIYPSLSRADWLGRLIGMPYLPITPTFPWFGVFGLIPLPSKWSIDFCKPVKFRQDATGMSEDYLVVSLLTEMIRKEIQTTLLRRVKRRRSIWY